MNHSKMMGVKKTRDFLRDEDRRNYFYIIV